MGTSGPADCKATRIACAAVAGVQVERSTTHTPRAKPDAACAATHSANAVLPMPPAATIVVSRWRRTACPKAASSCSRPISATQDSSGSADGGVVPTGTGTASRGGAGSGAPPRTSATRQ